MRVMPEMFSVALPVLERVVEMAVAVDPTVVSGKLIVVGEREAAGAVAAEPLPCRRTICGEPAALVGTESEAVRAPVAVGSKVTLRTQVLPGCRL